MTRPALAVPGVYDGFTGHWAGTLEYRDYQSNKRVKLPTTLTIQPAPGGSALICHYVYNDGPGKTVAEAETVTIDSAARTYSVLGDGDKKPAVYRVSGLPTFTKTHQGILILAGSGQDNDKPADFRKTITLTATTLTILKEVRPFGGAFQFRNQYTFTRLPKIRAVAVQNRAVSIQVSSVPRVASAPTEYLLTPPVLPGSGPAWRMAQEDTLREAMFRYLFTSLPPDADWQPKVYYLSVQGMPWEQDAVRNTDPAAALLGRFRGSAPPVKGVSGLIRDESWNEHIQHHWVIYSVSSLEWTNDTSLEIDAEKSLSGCFGAESIRLRCQLQNGWWAITGIMEVSA